MPFAAASRFSRMPNYGKIEKSTVILVIESSILRVSTSPNDPVAADSLSSSTMFSGALHKLCEQIRMYDLDGGY